MAGRDDAGVCLATTAATPGGVWRHIVDLADALRERGLDVRVEIPGHAEGLRRDAENRGHRVGGPRFAREVFHVHLGNTYDRTMTVAAARARAAGARVVVTEHLPRSDASDTRLASRPPRIGATAAKTAFKRAQFALADRVIAVSTGSATFLTQRYALQAPKLVTIFNGVEVDVPPPPARSASHRPFVHLAATGSVIQQKGFDLLIAAGRLAQRDWRVDVYGAGPHLASVQTQAAGIRLSDGSPRLVYHGWTDNVRAGVSSADALVMTSRWEALPYSALEGMSWARPVIGTAVDGLTDVIVPGVTGLLMAPEPAAIAAAFDAFSADPSHGPAMGWAGRDRVRTHFSLDAMVARTVAVYQQCLGHMGVELGA